MQACYYSCDSTGRALCTWPVCAWPMQRRSKLARHSWHFVPGRCVQGRCRGGQSWLDTQGTLYLAIVCRANTEAVKIGLTLRALCTWPLCAGPIQRRSKLAWHSGHSIPGHCVQGRCRGGQDLAWHSGHFVPGHVCRANVEAVIGQGKMYLAVVCRSLYLAIECRANAEAVKVGSTLRALCTWPLCAGPMQRRSKLARHSGHFVPGHCVQGRCRGGQSWLGTG